MAHPGAGVMPTPQPVCGSQLGIFNIFKIFSSFFYSGRVRDLTRRTCRTPLGAVMVDAVMQPLSQIQECNNVPGDGSDFFEFSIRTSYRWRLINYSRCMLAPRKMQLFAPTNLGADQTKLLRKMVSWNRVAQRKYIT